MTTRAVVLVPPAATAVDLLRPIAGVPALLRLLLTAQRAGFGEMLVLGANRCPAIVKESVTQDARLVARLVWLEDQPWSALLRVCPELEKEWQEGALWVLPASGVIDVRLLRNAIQQEATRPITIIDTAPQTFSTYAPPFFRVSGPWLQPIAEASGDVALSSLLCRLPRCSDVQHLPNHGLVCAPVASEAHRTSVERGLLKALDSSSDGWVDRHVNRKLSPWFSRGLLRTPLTPNQVSLIALGIGLLAALSFTHGSWLSGVVGALLLQWSAVIDCCDGEVARLKFLESTSGYYLDITCDNIVHVAVFTGIAWSSYQAWGRTSALLLGGLAAFGTMMAFVVVLATRHGRARDASAALDRLIDALSNRDFSLILVVCALTATLEWFLWALAIGVNLFWPIVLGLARKTQRTADG
ncbi:MAG TPA: CDP-alcohol phosphatidyltransferase family protein [Candidatus Tectomicrobia bacterium]|nr:CDP-alcohol phosphatidyltransferase family protein [Candidatus Tectomicrobia bacterium]